jgi:general secretion pathway protein M
MRQAWHKLQARERLVLLVGTVGLLGLLFQLFFWAPINEERSRLRASIAEQRELLAWMTRAAEKVRLHRRGAAAAADGTRRSLLSGVEAAATSMNLGSYLKRMQPEGDVNVRVWLESVAFDDVLAWVDEVSQGRDVVVKDVVVDRAAEQGKVNVRLLLQEGDS